MDKSWMLNPTAINAAKNCILIVQDELGIKLKLSHPQFLDMLKEYVVLTESEALQESYEILISFAGVKAMHFETRAPQRSHVVNTEPQTKAGAALVGDEEYVVYKGKAYKRFDNGREFKGLYRGQARYV